MPKYASTPAPSRSTSRTPQQRHSSPSTRTKAKPTALPPALAPAPATPRFLLSMEEVAYELHMSVGGVHKLLARGELGGSVKIGRRRLWPIKAIEVYIQERIEAAVVEEGGVA